MAKQSKKLITPETVLNKEWSAFNRALSKLSEVQLKTALDLELAGKNRSSYIDRIHTRFNTVRMARERKELEEKKVAEV